MLGCEQLILGGESLTAIVPHPEHIPFLAWASFVPAQTFWCLVCCVGVMPTMFVRDLTFLSYVSAAGILFTSTIVLLVGGEAATTIGAGTSEWQPFEVVNWSGVMLALSMYAFCYSGHAVFPKLYNGMSSPEQYPGMMWLSLGMATVMYIVMGLLGYGMYGKDVGDNIVVQMRVSTPAQFTLRWRLHDLTSWIRVHQELAADFPSPCPLPIPYKLYPLMSALHLSFGFLMHA